MYYVQVKTSQVTDNFRALLHSHLSHSMQYGRIGRSKKPYCL
jgi:hypothetical protein